MPQARILLACALAFLLLLQAGCIPTPALKTHDDYDNSASDLDTVLIIRSPGDHPAPHDPFWKHDPNGKFRDEDTLTKSGKGAVVEMVSENRTTGDATGNSDNHDANDNDTKHLDVDTKTKKPPIMARLIMGLGGTPGLKFKDIVASYKTKKPTSSLVSRAAFFIFNGGSKHKDQSKKPKAELQALTARDDVDTTNNDNANSNSLPSPSDFTLPTPFNPLPSPTQTFAGWTNPLYNATACAHKQAAAQSAYDAMRARCFTPGQPRTGSEEECRWAGERGPVGCCLAVQFAFGLSGKCQRWWPDVNDWEDTVVCCKGRKGTRSGGERGD